MAFETPDSLYYLETHEWLRVEGKTGTIGITDFAQDELGDVVFVELPESDRTLELGEQFEAIESIKAMSDLYSPAAGRVVEINDALLDEPERVNQDPYGEGWMIRIHLAGEPDFESVLTATEYTAMMK